MASHQNRVVSPWRLEALAALFFFFFFAFETLALLQARLLGVRARVQGEHQVGSVRVSWGSCTSPWGEDLMSGPHSRHFQGSADKARGGLAQQGAAELPLHSS